MIHLYFRPTPVQNGFPHLVITCDLMELVVLTYLSYFNMMRLVFKCFIQVFYHAVQDLSRSIICRHKITIEMSRQIVIVCCKRHIEQSKMLTRILDNALWSYYA